MGKRRYLNQRQLTVLDDLFNSDLDEQGVLEKHKVRRSTYERWLDDELFKERFNQYINRIKRRSELLLAKYSCLAAAKLVELTASEKAETARKACLDIISTHASRTRDDGRERKDETASAADSSPISLSPEKASRLLSALAE